VKASLSSDYHYRKYATAVPSAAQNQETSKLGVIAYS
jgi:hypothetical protein